LIFVRAVVACDQLAQSRSEHATRGQAQLRGVLGESGACTDEREADRSTRELFSGRHADERFGDRDRFSFRIAAYPRKVPNESRRILRNAALPWSKSTG